MLIRQGERRDADNLAALAMQVWLHTYATEGISSVISHYVLSEFRPEKFEVLLARESSAVFVAEVGQHLVGYATVTADTVCPVAAGAKAELATLYVQAPYIGQGVGSALLVQAEQWARQRLNTSVWLTVNSRNFRAIAFYTKRGYAKLGITHFVLGNEAHENLVLGGSATTLSSSSMNSPRRFVYVWEFEVANGFEAQFLEAYGPSGTWARLFGRADGYVGTLLLHDQADPARYLTVDRWRSPQAFEAFRAQFGAEYAELDRLCAALTSRESSLGSYWEVL